MSSRRALLQSSLAILASRPLTAKDDFWIAKPVEQWTEEEVRKFQTKSPWAKEVTVTPGGLAGGGMRGGIPDASGMGAGAEMAGGGMGGAGGGMGGGGGGGGRGGGRGGSRGGPPSGGGMPEIKLTVRWESAAPVRRSAKRDWPPETNGNYIVSVSGLPRMGRGGQSAQGRGAANPQDPQASAEARKRMEGALLASTELRRKGRPATPPEVARFFDSGPRSLALFLFPIGKEPIQLDEKEVTFFTKMGPFEVKTKFNLKEMQFEGALAL
ncbi:MAG: hypothetical protein JNL98_06280 [Bryobacterales bacterium]|nr:hypothetical protein [Bryobacterales bacterium]